MNTILRNFFTTLKRFQLASALNLLGLSIAYAAFMVIMMQVNYEYSFDKVIKDSDRIYRINTEWDNFEKAGIVSRASYDALSKSSSAVEQATFFEPSWGTTTYLVVNKNGQDVGFNENVYLAWETLPEFFGFKLIAGDFKKFQEPNTLIFPKSFAQKLFGYVDIVGQTVKYGNNGKEYSVVAVFEVMPDNTQLGNKIWAHFPKDKHVGVWSSANYSAFVKINQNSTKEQVEQDFSKIEKERKTSGEEGLKFDLTALSEIYFGELMYGDEFLYEKGNKDTTDILFAIAILIIIIASINFVNFSTSLAPLRIKSINTQKVLGSPISMLRGSLIVEAVGINILSFLISLIWVYCLGTTSWQNITAAGIDLNGNSQIIILTTVLSLIIGLIAGVYPAYYTTKFPPALILKGSFAMSKSGRMLRMALVGVQFVVSITLIIGAVFLQIQNNYVKKVDKGYNSEQIVVVSLGGELNNKIETVQNRIKNSPYVEDVACSQFRMGRDNMAQGWGREFKSGEEQLFQVVVVSYNFPKVMGMEIIDGDHMVETETKTNEVRLFYILNETAQKKFGVDAGLIFDQYDSLHSVVRSIVKDYNFKTLRMSVEPMALVVPTSVSGQWVGSYKFVYVKTKNDPVEAIKQIEKIVKEIDPTYPVEIEFFDEGFQQMYKQDIQISKLITFFSALAILISLVGVFGLIVFETQYKRKEIGVRKIMGSTVWQILIMLNKKFLYIVLVCYLLAVPISYLGVSIWLEGFTKSTPMHWWVFALGGLVVLIITIVVVTVQSYRSATENPVKSLKSE